MANLDVTLKDMMAIDGAMGAAIVDYGSGMALGHLGSSNTFDLSVAAAGNTEVVRAKLRTMEQLGIQEEIEDILISISSQYHVIRPVTGRKGKGLFVYMVLDRSRANLALARHKLKDIEQNLEV